MSRSQFQSKVFILRHAWLNLWDKRMTTGRINQVDIFEQNYRNWPNNFKPQHLHHIHLLRKLTDSRHSKHTLAIICRYKVKCFRKKDKQLDRKPSRHNNHWVYIHLQQPITWYQHRGLLLATTHASLTSTSHTLTHSMIWILQQPPAIRRLQCVRRLEVTRNSTHQLLRHASV